MSDVLRIATRQSPLALWQANFVKDRLHEQYPNLSVSLVPLTTQGDKILDKTLSKVGGKGLFVKELEQALLDKRADVAVHSIKDMPMQLPEGLMLGPICRRADPRDSLVSRDNQNLTDLPPGAIIGTSSLRRQSQLLTLRSDITVKPLRGNVGTRLGKLAAGEYDAMILAAAGLKRLGLASKITESFATDVMLPGVGQGAIGIEHRAGDTRVSELLAFLEDSKTRCCILAERRMNLTLGGSCQTPIGGFATQEENTLHLKGLVAMPDGSRILRAEERGAITDFERIGETVAEKLLADGAQEILAATRD